MSFNPRILSVGMCLALLAGCASTTIYPEGDNNFSLVTTSSAQGAAESDAKNKAMKYCQKMGQRLVVLKHRTKYQGVPKNEAAIVGLASAVLGSPNTASSSSDYQVTMKFTCK